MLAEPFEHGCGECWRGVFGAWCRGVRAPHGVGPRVPLALQAAPHGRARAQRQRQQPQRAQRALLTRRPRRRSRSRNLRRHGKIRIHNAIRVLRQRRRVVRRSSLCGRGSLGEWERKRARRVPNETFITSLVFEAPCWPLRAVLLRDRAHAQPAGDHARAAAASAHGRARRGVEERGQERGVRGVVRCGGTRGGEWLARQVAQVEPLAAQQVGGEPGAARQDARGGAARGAPHSKRATRVAATAEGTSRHTGLLPAVTAASVVVVGRGGGGALARGALRAATAAAAARGAASASAAAFAAAPAAACATARQARTMTACVCAARTWGGTQALHRTTPPPHPPPPRHLHRHRHRFRCRGHRRSGGAWRACARRRRRHAEQQPLRRLCAAVKGGTRGTRAGSARQRDAKALHSQSPPRSVRALASTPAQAQHTTHRSAAPSAGVSSVVSSRQSISSLSLRSAAAQRVMRQRRALSAQPQNLSQERHGACSSAPVLVCDAEPALVREVVRDGAAEDAAAKGFAHGAADEGARRRRGQRRRRGVAARRVASARAAAAAAGARRLVRLSARAAHRAAGGACAPRAAQRAHKRTHVCVCTRAPQHPLLRCWVSRCAHPTARGGSRWGSGRTYDTSPHANVYVFLIQRLFVATSRAPPAGARTRRLHRSLRPFPARAPAFPGRIHPSSRLSCPQLPPRHHH
jgi:hypothetical protein